MIWWMLYSGRYIEQTNKKGTSQETLRLYWEVAKNIKEVPMRYGRFDDKQREYIIDRPATPLPWIN
jgi:cellobiose phosphorylase